jgi:hypothetical protein
LDCFLRPHTDLCTFHGANTPLIEIDFGRQRLDAQQQVLGFDAAARDLERETLQDLVVQRVPFGLTPVTFRFACRYLGVQA